MAGTFIYIYLTVSMCGNASCKRPLRSHGIDSLSLLTRCRRVSLVLELLL